MIKKYINSDLENSRKLMKVAIMNAIHFVASGQIERIDFGQDIPWNIVNECLKENNLYFSWDSFADKNGWEEDWSTIAWNEDLSIVLNLSGSMFYGSLTIEKRDTSNEKLTPVYGTCGNDKIGYYIRIDKIK